MSAGQQSVSAVADAGRKSLKRAVLSSCSDRPLADLILEVHWVSQVRVFDLLILRDIDVWEINRWLGGSNRHLEPRGEEVTSTQILAVDGNLDLIREWIVAQFEACNRRHNVQLGENRIAALATFFPDITSRSNERRGTAVRALANTVRLALALNEAGLIQDSCWGRDAIVELVCGTIVDRCECERCERLRQEGEDYAVVATPDSKIALLRESLAEVANLVGEEDNWALALELEPGPTYVLNDIGRIAAVFDGLDERLAAHVGLNLDIAHMKIAGVPATRRGSPQGLPGLDDFADRLVHAHVCDHPGMHTRDQIVGSWIPVERYGSEDYEYVELLSDIRNGSPRASRLPFSGTMALELEGCNRIRWIHQSLSAMKHICEMVKNRPSEWQQATRDG